MYLNVPGYDDALPSLSFLASVAAASKIINEYVTSR